MLKPTSAKKAVQLAEQKSTDVKTELKKDERSKDNAAMFDIWKQIADVRGGIRAMREAGKTYISKFADETNDEYQFRLTLAKMTNIFKDVSDALAAKPFAKEVKIKNETLENAFEEIEENIDGTGNNLTQFAAKAFSNGINNGLHWIFVDFPKVDRGTIVTVADAKRAAIRPYWSHVLAENMLEVKTTFINAQEVLTYCRILEPEIPAKVREFTRLETGGITWELWEKTAKGDWVIIDGGFLEISQIPLFPFMTGERDGKTWVFNPPLQDACDLQVTLYRQESQLEFTKTMTAYPMLAGNGVRPPLNAAGLPGKLTIGPNRVLYAPPDGNGNSGNWSYVEPSSSSLTFLSNDVEKTKQDIRELGKQPLTATSGNLTVITTAVAAGKAKSAVKQWGLDLKNTLEKAILCSFEFMGLQTDETPEIEIFDDYDNFAEGDIAALTSARTAGDISRKTFLSELKRRAILSADFDYDAETECLLNETPSEVGEPDEDETEL